MTSSNLPVKRPTPPPPAKLPWRTRLWLWWTRPSLSKSATRWAAAAKDVARQVARDPSAHGGEPTFDALAVATLRTHEVRALLAVLDVDVDLLDAAVRAALPKVKSGALDLGHAFGRAYSDVILKRTTELNPALLFACAVSHPGCIAVRAALEAVNVKPIDVWRAHAHGEDLREEVKTDPALDDVSEAEIVVFNDDVSTQEFVAKVFVEVLDVDGMQANDLMLDIHQTDDAVVHQGPPAECIRLRRAILTRAEAELMPLRVVVRAT